MLLRSSSSPVLESLLPSLVSCHTDPSADIRHESQAAEAAVPKCLSLTSRGSASNLLTNCLTNIDPQSQVYHGGYPSPSIRQVLSENDLHGLASPSSSTPAVIAANSLLQDDGAEADLGTSRSHVTKPRPLQPLSRWLSLGSLPSELPSDMFFDRDSTIFEEGELESWNSSASNEVEEDGERSCPSDKLALPVSKMLEADVKRVNHLADTGIKHSMINDSSLSQSTADKTDIQDKYQEMDRSKNTAYSAALERHDLSRVACQGTSCLFGGIAGTVTLVPQVHDQASQPEYVYHGDASERMLDAGAGGRGSRPPTSPGSRGGSGDGGGHSGRSADSTELHYQSMLRNNPGHPLILQNYAQYLMEVKRDYQRAEEFYQRAILANPSDGELLSNYAKMLWEVQRDRERAATYFERAVQAAPDNSYVMAAYASFLWSAEEEEEEEQGGMEELVSTPANVTAGLFSIVSTGLI